MGTNMLPNHIELSYFKIKKEAREIRGIEEDGTNISSFRLFCFGSDFLLWKLCLQLLSEFLIHKIMIINK